MKTTDLLRIFIVFWSFSALFGCATQVKPVKNDPLSTTPELTTRGTMLYSGEFEFIPPPSQWEMIKGSQFSHYLVGFYRKDFDKSPTASSFIAYDEDPYGTATELEDRSRQCLKRYFWASMLQKVIVEKKKVSVLGGEGLAITFELKDPSKKLKVKSKLVFGYRGERVVLFYINQWRSIDGRYDSEAFDIFDKFTSSFIFLKKSFYETL